MQSAGRPGWVSYTRAEPTPPRAFALVCPSKEGMLDSRYFALVCPSKEGMLDSR